MTGEFRIANRKGLHARAAARFVGLASSFVSAITVRCGDQEVDGKSILSLMTLGAALGATLVVMADGPDEAEALAGLRALIGDRFDEGE